MRECADFFDIRGDIAFLNGVFAAYVEETLYEAFMPDNTMLHLISDVFYLGDDNEIPPDKALSDQVKSYLEIGTFDKENNFIPNPSNDDFHFSFSDLKEETEGMEKALYWLIGEYSDEEKVSRVISKFKTQFSYHLREPDHIYYSNSDLIDQLRESVHFHLLPTGAVFFVSDSYVLMLTIGWND